MSRVWGEVLKHEISGLERKTYPFKEVCKSISENHVLLTQIVSTTKLDCMGKVVDTFDFCAKKNKSLKNLIRGYTNKNLNEVICEFGKSVHLSLSCDKKHKVYCKEPEKSCKHLGGFFAKQLNFSHHSLVEKDIDNILNCYYVIDTSSKSALEIDEDIFSNSKSKNDVQNKKD